MSILNTIESKKPPSNIFDLSHDRKTSLKFGELTPILSMDLVPGDKINMTTSQMLRLAPMVSPVMHRMNVFTHFYFVPNRILWDNWEDFITGGEDGLADPVFPTVTLDGFAMAGGLEDHLGIPLTPNTANIEVSALPFSAYQLIYDEYYRDQNLIAKQAPKLDDGSQGILEQLQLKTIRRRAYEHDYFTSALPWTQRGVEATIPLGTTAEIESRNDIAMRESQRMYDGGQPTPISQLDLAVGTNTAFGDTANTQDWWLDLKDSHYVDLSSATAASINDLRQAFKLQEWLEKNARGGSRYAESMRSHFNVISPDARLQRPEYLGGGMSPITISEVLQTQGTPENESLGTTPLGTQGGHGISVGNNASINYRATEHGYLIGIMSIMPRTAYYQGIPKHLKKFDKFDYYWPSFAHLGEQPILNEEIFIQGDAKDQETFGYTPRYAEYKVQQSSVHGQFRTSLDFWHMARKFDTPPTLNARFIECRNDDDNIKRIFAVTDSEAEEIYAQIHHKIKAKRLMPYFGTPSL